MAKDKLRDFFAGVCAIDLAFHKAGAEFIFASDWDSDARLTYEANFCKISSKMFKLNDFFGNTKQVKKSTIPNFDILTYGFPDQPLSQAGQGKGFKDASGTFFLDLSEIVRLRRSQAFFYVYVQRLHWQNGGRTINVIEQILRKVHSYNFFIRLFELLPKFVRATRAT